MVAVLFDVDGVLIDSLDVHRDVWRTWAEVHGLDSEAVWGATFGRRPEDTMALVAPELDPIVERRALDRLLNSREADIETFPGARGLLARLGSTPWAVVTSGSRDVTMKRFRRLGLPLPVVGVCGEDVQLGKPDPEGYLQACRRLDVAPEDCIAIEDAPTGIAAAGAAGCMVIAVTTTHSREACAEAHEIVEGLEQLELRIAPFLAKHDRSLASED